MSVFVDLSVSSVVFSPSVCHTLTGRSNWHKNVTKYYINLLSVFNSYLKTFLLLKNEYYVIQLFNSDMSVRAPCINFE